MREENRSLQILFDEIERKSLPISYELVEAIYELEERVQFQEQRGDTARKVAELVRAVVERDELSGRED